MAPVPVGEQGRRKSGSSPCPSSTTMRKTRISSLSLSNITSDEEEEDSREEEEDEGGGGTEEDYKENEEEDGGDGDEYSPPRRTLRHTTTHPTSTRGPSGGRTTRSSSNAVVEGGDDNGRRRNMEDEGRSPTPNNSNSVLKARNTEDTISIYTQEGEGDQHDEVDDKRRLRDRKDDDGGSKYTTEESESEQEQSEDDERVRGICVRRSLRARRPVVYRDNLSWVAGGGAKAKGYFRGMYEDTDEYEDEEFVPRPRTSSATRRYLTRLSSNEKQEQCSGRSGRMPNGVSRSQGEDMYSRVKRRRTRNNSTDDGAIQQNVNLNLTTNDEPVSRRLRDRNKLLKAIPMYAQFTEDRNQRSKKNKRSKRNRRSGSSSSSSTDSDDTQVMSPRKKSRKKMMTDKIKDMAYSNMHLSEKERKRLMEIQPVAVDPSITFKSVGGLTDFIEKLKEIVIFPLVYNEFYENRGITAPKGVLLYGPPGTGKTLLARALSNECSNINGRKVSFFLRKGADLLNKFVGESERQLRMLFQQAAAHQPSIIFFDEIDGLAPVRSAKSDQIHNSIVSSLLAEIDGLQDRGQVIIMGSTNRLDFVDPALRRPGRFDCELPIFLPTRDGRKEILDVHISKLKDKTSVPPQLLNELADRTIGFNGADLRHLCWEANMNALRRRYPQIYGSSQKYLLDYDSIKVGPDDWDKALQSVAPSTQRSVFSSFSPAQPLPEFVKPLLHTQVTKVLDHLKTLFPHDMLSLINEPSIKRCMIQAAPDSGLNNYIVPAILHSLEKVPVHVLSFETLHMNGSDVEFCVTQKCLEVTKQSKPCICYMPDLEGMCDLLSDSSKEILIRMLRQSIQKPILFLATVERSELKSSRNFKSECNFMEMFQDWTLQLHCPLLSEVEEFFRPVFEEAAKVVITNEENYRENLPELPLAPPELPKKPKLTEQELRCIEKYENSTFRELRIFLRQILTKLARNKKFEEFTRPVDFNEVPDYRDLIAHPMDLETMMMKLNNNEYFSAAEFLDDIKLIYSNCLQYNPEKTESDKRLRMRAFELKDFAEKLIEDEMDSDFEQECQKIIQTRKERNHVEERQPAGESWKTCFTKTAKIKITPLQNGEIELAKENGNCTPQPSTSSNSARPKSAVSATSSSPSKAKKRKSSSWARGTVKKPPRKIIPKTYSSSGSPEIKVEPSEQVINDGLFVPVYRHKKKPVETATSSGPCDVSGNACVVSSAPKTARLSVQSAKSPGIGEEDEHHNMVVQSFAPVLEKTTKTCSKFPVVKLIDVRFHLLRLVNKYQCQEDKETLKQEMNSYLISLEPAPLQTVVYSSSHVNVKNKIHKVRVPASSDPAHCNISKIKTSCLRHGHVKP